MIKLKKFIGFAILLVILVFLVQAKKDPIHVNVRLKWLHNAQFAGMYVADAQGFYKDEDIKVSLLAVNQEGKQAVDEVVDGDVQFAIVSTARFLQGIDEGKKIKAVAVYYQYSPSVIVSLKSRNIVDVTDLRGKTIGITSNDKYGRANREALLGIAGVPINSVKFKDVGFYQVDALVSGDVDAVTLYRTSDLYELKKQNLEYNLILPERNGVDLYDDVLIASEEFIDENEELVKDFVLATGKGWEYAFENKDKALDIVMARANGKYKDRDFEAFILNESEPLMLGSRQGRIGFMSPLQWDHSYDLFHNKNIIGDYDIHKYFLANYFFD